VISRLRAAGIRLYATTARDGRPLDTCDLQGPSAILLGGEGPGLDARLAQLADVHVTVPMRSPVESLNVAIAAAIIVYEAARQRHARARDRSAAGKQARPRGGPQ
jgi:RNA methyltransferase, TrmH family